MIVISGRKGKTNFSGWGGGGGGGGGVKLPPKRA